MNCLVTGSGKGIGKAIALEFASHGCNVAVNYSHSEAKAKDTVLEAQKKGVKAVAIKADVSDEKQSKFLVEKAFESFGPIDFLVNNAGVYAKKPGTPFYELSLGEWDEVMAVNAKGMFLVSKFAAKKMIDAKTRGSIVNISSISGLDSSMAGAHYCASKHAVIGLTKTMSAELGKFGIRVNSIAPGAVETDLLADVPESKKESMRLQTPLLKLSTVEDIAKAAYALASLENVSGQTLVVDGGRLKH